ncbi:hypothetical protein PF004_g16234 [Phytophthora fragariae]|uniref:Uncharacterized protein n=1 Tax=Phytophthora fragariae TaxID=53985 RepID=A0A6G0NIX6_9STRA|nr:hypothetical protein PF004_g16234 [Phytophthora fragariae]
MRTSSALTQIASCIARCFFCFGPASVAGIREAQFSSLCCSFAVFSSFCQRMDVVMPVHVL